MVRLFPWQCLLAIVSLAFVPSALRADLIHYWPLNEGSGSTTANLGTLGAPAATIDNHLTGGQGPGGAAWITDDMVRGTVLSGNGNNTSGAFVTAAGIPHTVYNSNWTISSWVALSGGTGENDVILGNRFGGPNGRWAKLTRSNFEWRTDGTQGNITGTNIPLDDVWRHHTITKSGTTFQYFVDGNLVNSATITGTFPAGTVPFFLGGDSGGERIAGRYDDVGFFDEALSPGKIASISQLANAPSLGYDLGQANSLFEAFDVQGSVDVGDGLVWQFATVQQLSDAGLLGPLGVPQMDSDDVRFGILFDDNIGGLLTAVPVVPEPASLAIWGLVGLCLFAIMMRRRRLAAALQETA